MGSILLCLGVEWHCPSEFGLTCVLLCLSPTAVHTCVSSFGIGTTGTHGEQSTQQQQNQQHFQHLKHFKCLSTTAAAHHLQVPLRQR